MNLGKNIRLPKSNANYIVHILTILTKVMNRKFLPYILIILLAIATLLIKSHKDNILKTSAPATVKATYKQTRGLNRNPSYIKYSKHSRCRMQCRHIEESEVKDILVNGTVNYKKSELQGNDLQ